MALDVVGVAMDPVCRGLVVLIGPGEPVLCLQTSCVVHSYKPIHSYAYAMVECCTELQVEFIRPLIM